MSSSHEDDDEILITRPIKFVTAAPDARFPNVNQTKHCWQNYVDYHKCTILKGEDFAPCKQFLLAYRSLCPGTWTRRWDAQREYGNFPYKFPDKPKEESSKMDHSSED